MSERDSGSERPKALRVEPENIPAALAERPQWVLWKYEFRKGKWTKPPYRPDGGTADSTDPATWRTLGDVLAAYNRGGWDGVGFVHTPADGLTAVDADHCRDPETGTIRGNDAAALLALDTYTEVSPSGTGLRAFAFGTKPGRRCKKGDFELYDGATADGKAGGRFLTVTGHRLDIASDRIEQRQDAISEIYHQYWPPEAPRTASQPAPPVLEHEPDRLRLMLRNPKARALYDGDTSSHGGDDSRADSALCFHLVFWFGPNATTVEEVFNGSRLGERGKWRERPDYRKRTIAAAIEKVKTYFVPRPRATVGPARFGTVARADSDADDVSASATEGLPPVPPPDGFSPPDDGETWSDPHRLARLFVDRHRTPDGERTLIHWRDEYHEWRAGAWHPLPDAELDARVVRHAREVFVADMPARIAAWEADAAGAKEGKQPKRPTIYPVSTKVRSDVRANLAGLVSEPDDGRSPPFWLGGACGEEPSEVIAAPNGLFTLQAIAQGLPPFAPATPRFFTPNTLPFDVPPGEQPAPELWMRCLREWFNGDVPSILGLQEWMGYLLSASTAAHKIMFLIGLPRSGKGTVLYVIGQLLGHSNVASTTFAALGENFGLEPLIGRRAAFVPDARLSARTDVAHVVERLLSISGEDAQTVNRKNRPRVTTQLKVRFTLASNEMPRLPDASGALPSRFLFLRMPNTFLGRENTELRERLRAELPAILAWAARGYCRLLTQNMRFTENDAATECRRDLDDLSSPARAFLRERCNVGPEHAVLVSDLYASWGEWNEQRGRDPGIEQIFGRDLKAAVPGIRVSQPWQRDAGGRKYRVRMYNGVSLRPREEWGEEELARDTPAGPRGEERSGEKSQEAQAA